MCEGSRVREIVHRDEIDVRITERRAKDVASDASEPVNTNLYCHSRNPPAVRVTSRQRCAVFGIKYVAIVGQSLAFRNSKCQARYDSMQFHRAICGAFYETGFLLVT